jgi:hypothetical protein
MNGALFRNLPPSHRPLFLAEGARFHLGLWPTVAGKDYVLMGSDEVAVYRLSIRWDRLFVRFLEPLSHSHFAARYPAHLRDIADITPGSRRFLPKRLGLVAFCMNGNDIISIVRPADRQGLPMIEFDCVS